MNDIEFLNDFLFREIRLTNYNHRDNSHGVDRHFIGFMKKGRGILTLPDKSIEIYENEMFYIPKGCKYHSYWIGEKTVIFDSLAFNHFPTESSGGYTVQKINYTDEIYECFRPLSLNKELNVASIGRLYTLLGKLEQIMERAGEDRASETVERALKLMHKDHMKSIPEYARECGISESLLYLYFKEAYGTTPNEARRNVACRKAVDLLTSSNLSIEEICGAVGFSSSSYFRKVLFKTTGKTPSQIRKTAKIL